jgi:hypothetical protein
VSDQARDATFDDGDLRDAVDGGVLDMDDVRGGPGRTLRCRIHRVISGPRQFLPSGHNRLDQRSPNQPQHLRLTGLPSWTGELITEVPRHGQLDQQSCGFETNPSRSYSVVWGCFRLAYWPHLVCLSFMSSECAAGVPTALPPCDVRRTPCARRWSAVQKRGDECIRDPHDAVEVRYCSGISRVLAAWT